MKRFGTSRRLIIVLEHGVVGWESVSEHYTKEVPLSRLVREVDGLSDSLAARLATQDSRSANIDELTLGISIIPCTWESLTAEMERSLNCVVELPPAALAILGRSLLSIVADAVDANAESDSDSRISLNRTAVIKEINSVAELIDKESIEQALVEGVCGIVDWEPSQIGDAYYEGMSTQPGHVSAGLVVARPDVTSQAMAGLDGGQTVLLVGPSGVGKSAALWTLPHALPGILWFRVHRLSVEDISRILRLIRAYRPSPNSPVGLLVDGVGRGNLDGLAQLCRSVASMEGVLLAGTVRNEDLFPIGSLENCVFVQVAFDALSAERIHAGLYQRGATALPHWQEAFEQAGGLTLEFTHILTQGSRLEDVIRDQVRCRVRECRSVELEILALVTVADRWSASIPVGKLEAALRVTRLELRSALERLESEHLIVERDGLISGLHQVRSKGIVDVIHSIPPPTHQQTILSVLDMLSGSTLSRFIFEVLRELPDLEAPMLRALEILTRNDMERLVECLRGLDLLDFYKLASAWVEIAKDRDVPSAHLPLILSCAVTGAELPDFLPVEIKNVVEEMAAIPSTSVTRDMLLRDANMGKIASTLAAMSTADSCLRLLRAMNHTTLDEKPLLDALEPSSVLVNTLRGCSPRELGACVAAARDISPNLARALVDAVGGADAVLQRFRNHDPWIRELEVATLDGELVGVARLLHVSDTGQGDLQERAHNLGMQLIQALPEIVRVDIKGELPGGHGLTLDGIDYGSSGLLRQYVFDAFTIRRNKERFRLAHTMVGTTDTERLPAAAELLADVADLVRDFGNVFVQSRGGSREVAELGERRIELNERARQLPPVSEHSHSPKVNPPS